MTYRIRLFTCAATLLVSGGIAILSAAEPDAVWELRPYQLQVLLVPDESPAWTDDLLQQLAANLTRICRTEIGGPWRVTLRTASRPVRHDIWSALVPGSPRARMQPERIVSLLEPNERVAGDKLSFILLDGLSPSRTVAVCTRDQAGGRWGPLHRAPCPTWQDVAPVAFRLLLASTPSEALIKQVDGDRVVLRPRAALLPVRSRPRADTLKDTVFQVAVRGPAPDSLAVLPATFLVVERDDDPALVCRLLSRYADPLSHLPLDGWIALGVRPAAAGTRWQLTRPGPTAPVPVTGCDLRLSDSPEQIGTPIGRTDGEGFGQLPTTNQVKWLQVAWRSVVLEQIPVVPGWPTHARWDTDITEPQLRAASALDVCHTELAELTARRDMDLQRIALRREQGRTQQAEELQTALDQHLQQRVEELRELFHRRRAESNAASDPLAPHWLQLDSLLTGLLAPSGEH